MSENGAPLTASTLEVRRRLQNASQLSVAQIVELLQDDQLNRWRLGQRVPAEAYLQILVEARPGEESDVSDDALDVVYAEIVLRRQRGEEPTLEEFLWRFPRLASRLNLLGELEGSLDCLSPAPAGVGSANSPPIAPTQTNAEKWPHVPGYEVLAELGRGGMGVVYKARQTTLGRLVALKLIRGGEDVDAASLARFRVEAEAVAQLHHPHIVQIHEIGGLDADSIECPYMALEFVEGGNLAQSLERAALPALEAGQLVETLARAMHYAHQRGVLHRDLKPSNILLQKEESREARGENRKQGSSNSSTVPGIATDYRQLTTDYSRSYSPKITDFGLAKRLNEGNDSQTRTGSLLGTPCYMAPEQAAGLNREIGVATDVHALGAILYETLAGRPPFRAETPIATLEQVRNSDPVPPSRFRADVPRDLEIICLKCLKKSPCGRYASALDLAEDLRRSLAGEPIEARPTGRLERCVLWSRRNPRVAGLLALLIVVVSSGLIGLTALWQHAAHQRGHAEASFQKAREAVDKIMMRIGEEPATYDPRQEQVRWQVLEEAMGFYHWFLEQKNFEPDVRFDAGRVSRRVGAIHVLLGQTDQAEQDFHKAISLQEKLAQDFPRDERYRLEWALDCHALGNLFALTGKVQAAVDYFERARTLLEPLSEDASLSDSPSQCLGQLLCSLATRQVNSGRLKEAEETYGRAHRLLAQCVDANPAQAEYRHGLACCQQKWAELLLTTARFRDAEVTNRKALALLEALVKEVPMAPAYRLDCARTYSTLGLLLRVTDRLEEAGKAFKKSAGLYESLSAEYPRVPEYQLGVAAAQHQLARVVGVLQGRATAELEVEKYVQAIGLCESLVNRFPQFVDYRRDLSALLQSLAVVLAYRGKVSEAERLHRRSLTLLENLVAEVPQSPAYRHQLSRVHLNFGVLLSDTGRLQEAAEGYRRARKLQTDLVREFPQVPDYQNILGALLENLAEIHERSGDHAGALELLHEAIACQRAVLATNPQDPTYIRIYFNHIGTLLDFHLKHGEHQEIARWALQLPDLHKGLGPPMAGLEFRTANHSVVFWIHDDAWRIPRTAAELLSRCIPMVNEDDKLSKVKKHELAQYYGDHAMRLIRLATEHRGWEGNPLMSDPHLVPLQQRPDFQKLAKELDAAAKPSKLP